MQQNKDQILVEENQGIVEVRNQNPFRILDLEVCIYRKNKIKIKEKKATSFFLY